MAVRGTQNGAVTICHLCQRPVADPSTGTNGEVYHRHCASSLMTVE